MGVHVRARKIYDTRESSGGEEGCRGLSRRWQGAGAAWWIPGRVLGGMRDCINMKSVARFENVDMRIFTAVASIDKPVFLDYQVRIPSTRKVSLVDG
jgi:hypothetical protein